MGMQGLFQVITTWQLDALLEQVRDNPEIFWEDLHPETRSFDKPDPRLDIGKAWAGIHYLLNGHPCQVTCKAGKAIFGGTPVGADFGYGPAEYLTAEQVTQITLALQTVCQEAFEQAFDWEAFREAKIYPSYHWDRPEDWKWLWSQFVRLRHFYEDAAQCRDAMLLWIA